MSEQLALDGTTVPTATVKPTAGFSHAQRDILRMLAVGPVRSLEAGRIVHLHRQPPCHYCTTGQTCPWASSDGGDALKRLMARGLVRRTRVRGLWERT